MPAREQLKEHKKNWYHAIKVAESAKKKHLADKANTPARSNTQGSLGEANRNNKNATSVGNKQGYTS